MRTLRFPLFKKGSFYFITTVCALATGSSFCGTRALYALSFFDNTVSFYSNGTPIDDTHFSRTELETNPHNESIRSLDNKPFSWDHYSDPNSPQFWDAGGDFVPSLPWRYLMTHPTQENAEHYQSWLDSKMALTVSASHLLTPVAQTIQTQQEKKEDPKITDWSSYTIAFFYQTQCPFCKKSEPIYIYLKNHGAHLIPIQLDATQNPPALEGSLPYTAEMDAQFHVTGTPTWIIKSATNSSKRIDGYASLAELERQAQEGGNAD